MGDRVDQALSLASAKKGYCSIYTIYLNKPSWCLIHNSIESQHLRHRALSDFVSAISKAI